MEEIRVEHNDDGTVTITVQGVPGPDCLERTKSLSARLGVTTKDVKTAEMYQVAKQAQKAKQKG